MRNGGHVTGADTCEGIGVDFNTIEVEKLDPSGNSIGQVWLIQDMSNNDSTYKIRQLSYGNEPKEWSVLVKARPIEAGIFYRLNGRFYFIKKENGTYILFSSGDYLSFMKKKQNREPLKMGLQGL